MAERTSEAKTCLDYGPQMAGLLDGELSASEQARIEEHLRQCPVCAESFRRQRAVRSALRLAATEFTAPANLRARVDARLDRAEARASWTSRLTLLGGMAAVLAVIAVIGLLRVQGSASAPHVLTAAAAVHRQETLSAAPVSFASSDPSAVAGWVRAASGHPIDVPSLAQEGYQLLGARAEPSLASGAVSLVYDGPGGRVTCAVLPVIEPLGTGTGASAGESAFQQAQVGSTSVAGWQETDATYVLAGNLSPASLLSLARAAAQQ